MTINSMIEDCGEDTFMGMDMTALEIDEAYLQIRNFEKETLYLYSLNTECVKCPFILEMGPLEQNATITISTRFTKIYRLLSSNDVNSNIVCEIDKSFGEFGVYKVDVYNETCNFVTLKEPVNIYLPILTVFLISLTLLLVPSYYLLRKRIFKTKINENTLNEEKLQAEKERLVSLDSFRGISIVVMIFVNYGGGGYVFMDHATWNGLNVADLVFPWFMWIMGVCIPISIKSVLKRNVPKRKAFYNILRRSCILFSIGLYLGSGINLTNMRIFGVLQRFGICYFVVTTLSLFMIKREEFEETYDEKWKQTFADLMKTYKLWIIMLFILLAHSLVIFFVPAAGCPKNYMGPGGYHENGQYFNCTGGVSGYIDKIILGKHAYQHPTIKDIYNSQAFDPEGILGCLTSIVQVFIGFQAGMILLTFRDYKTRLARWLLWSVVSGLVGGALCGFSKEDGIIPINKNLWSLSFVLVTSCFAFILLSICYILIDVIKVWSGKPFLFAGMNAIIMYIGHSMTYSNFPIRWEIEGYSTHFIRLFENVWATSMWVLIAFYLYNKKYFLSI